jgi:type IV fimbrial biogenesis protein FimT
MNTTFELSFSQIRSARKLTKYLARGFTLIEALVAMAVAATLLALAIPSIAGIVKSNKLTSASNIFVSGLFLARGEAIKRNARVVLCKSADGATCALSGGWEQGWIVFPDINNNGAREAAETVVQRETPLSGNLRVVGNLNVARYISFTPNGATGLTGGAFQAGTVTVCHASTERGEARQVILNATGRPRVQKTSVSACI